MKKFLIVAAGVLAFAPAAAQAQNMLVADFLRRSDAISMDRNGPNTPEYLRLQRQLNETAKLARNERRIARRQNRAPRACLRAGIRATTQWEIFAHLRSIPAAEAQTTTVEDAYMQLMARKFPCRG
ncbi:MAG TPA: hypothetical protein VEW25_06520 [Allosphingosinicella sp.]|nr:hypothetical protein [Allosphingosinicella sp.]